LATVCARLKTTAFQSRTTHSRNVVNKRMKVFWVIFSILDFYTTGRAIYFMISFEWEYISDDIGILLLTLVPIPLLILTGLSAVLQLMKKRTGIWLYFASVPLRVLSAFMSLSILMYFADPYQSWSVYYVILSIVIAFEIFRIIMSILMLRKAKNPVYNNS